MYDPQKISAWQDGQLQPMDKLDVHLRGLRHKAVSVFVLDGDRVLIQRRAMAKYHTPGLWANTCCTHPLWDEPPLDCAIRRLEQELGITGLAPEHRGVVAYRADVGGGMIEDEVVDVFTAGAAANLAVMANPDEVMGWRWISVNALDDEIARTPEQFTPWLRIYLSQHRSQIFAGAA